MFRKAFFKVGLRYLKSLNSSGYVSETQNRSTAHLDKGKQVETYCNRYWRQKKKSYWLRSHRSAAEVFLVDCLPEEKQKLSVNTMVPPAWK